MDAAKVNTLVDLFRERAAESGDRPAMRLKKGHAWESMTYKDVAKHVDETAAGLCALGVKLGERVAILSENRPEWAYSDLGILACGAADVPIYATNMAKQCEYIILNSESVGIIVSTLAQLQKIEEILPSCPGLRFVVVLDELPAERKKGPIMAYAELCAKGREKLAAEPGLLDERRRAIKAGDLCSLIYTSGTTGDPKGVMLTHDNFVSNVKSTVGEAKIVPGDVFLSFLPLSHVFERMGGYYMAIYAGAEIVYAESIDRLRDNLPEIRPTILCSVPRIYEKFFAGVRDNASKLTGFKGKLFAWGLEVGAAYSEVVRSGRQPGVLLGVRHAIADRLVLSKIRARFGGRLRFGVSGGAPLARDIAIFFHSVGVLILEGYGLTETSPVITVNRPEEFRLGTVGKPIPGVEVKFAADGEILARGPNIMKGYFKNEKATSEVLDADGWFKTGDIGELDPDGFLRITDRKKDLLKTSGGKYIAPQQIENEMKTQRTIAEFVVIGDNRAFPTGLVVPKFELLSRIAQEKGWKFGSNAELIALPEVLELVKADVELVNKHLPQYEKIKKYRLIDRELSQEQGELTPTLKVKRKVVNAKFKDLIEAMYAESKETADAKGS